MGDESNALYFRDQDQTNIELFVKSKETQIAAKAPLTPMSMRPKANVGKKIGSGWSCLSNGEHQDQGKGATK